VISIFHYFLIFAIVSFQNFIVKASNNIQTIRVKMRKPMASLKLTSPNSKYFN